MGYKVQSVAYTEVIHFQYYIRCNENLLISIGVLVLQSNI